MGIITRNTKAAIRPPKDIIIFAERVFLLPTPNNAISAAFDQEKPALVDINVEHVYMRPCTNGRWKSIARCAKGVQRVVKLD